MSGPTSRPRRRSRWPRHLKTTRQGKLLIGITLGLGFGAINSGNNLLYLILGMLLSFIVVSGILSELTLRGVRVRRHFQPTLHAGRDTFLTLEVRNHKARLSSFSVEVTELFEAQAGVHQRPGYALHVPPGETARAALKLRIARRGLYQSAGVRVLTRYPFSFFAKSRELLAPVTFVVYPALVDVVAPTLSVLSEGSHTSHRRLGRGGEYHGLREHRLGDDPRDIHWKSSARTGRLVTREYERSADRRIWLLAPNVAVSPDAAARDAVERQLSEVASLAAYYIGAGWAVGLQTLDGRVRPSAGPGALIGVLEHLAGLPIHSAPIHSKQSAPARIEVQIGAGGARLAVQTRAQARLGLVSRADRDYEVQDDWC